MNTGVKHKPLCRSRWVWPDDMNRRTGELKKGVTREPCDCGADGNPPAQSYGRLTTIQPAEPPS